MAAIHIGISGWRYTPWRGDFYPEGLTQKRELQFASRAVNSIEINGSFYALQTPKRYAEWYADTPEGFLFSLKANRFATHRRVLAEAGESITRFVESGISELKHKLGPIVWQFMPTKAFDPGDFEAFLALLPQQVDGLRLRHALDVRHPSFATPAFVALARRYGCVPVYTDSDQFPAIADAEADFAYLRLMRSQADVPTGYTAEAIAQWAQGVRTWTSGARPRDVFVYFINGAKERAPAGAMELLRQLGATPSRAV